MQEKLSRNLIHLHMYCSFLTLYLITKTWESLGIPCWFEIQTCFNQHFHIDHNELTKTPRLSPCNIRQTTEGKDFRKMFFFRNAYAVIHWRLFQFLTLPIKIMFTKVYCTILPVAFACRGSPWRLWLGHRWKYDSIKSYLHISVTWTCLNIKRTMVEVPRISWIKLCSSTCFVRNIFTVLRRFIR